VEAGGGVSDGRWEIYQQQRQEWEPIEGVAGDRHLQLDTSGPLTENIQELLYRFYRDVM
jgi:hypothetical protein